MFCRDIRENFDNTALLIMRVLSKSLIAVFVDLRFSAKIELTESVRPSVALGEQFSRAVEVILTRHF